MSFERALDLLARVHLHSGLSRAIGVAVILALSVATDAAHASTAPSVTLRPSQIALGETAELVLSVEGKSGALPDLPSVDGLQFDYVGHSSRMQSVNGALAVSESHHYRVRADRTGTFSIPSIQVRTDDGLLRTDPVAFEVSAGTSASHPRPRQGGGVARPDRRTTLDDSSGESLPFLRIVPEKETAFVGEVVPVEIQAWFPQDQRARLDSNPRPEGNAFTLALGEEEPDRSHRLHGGQGYTVLTWTAALSAVKEGRHPFASAVDATLVARAPQRRKRPSRFGGPLDRDPFDALAGDFFDDDFFGDFFAPTQERGIELKSPPLDLEVRALPLEGRPEAFRGAVGHFELVAEPSARRLAVGDPLTLRSRVRGTGNFDRVTAPVLEGGDAWKTYDAEGEFEASDGLGRVGSKSFEQVIVPKGRDIEALPPVVFHYFDPDLEAYVTRRCEPVPLVVDGASQGQVAAMATRSSKAVVADDRLVPDHPLPRASSQSLRPLGEGAGFRIWVGVSAFLLLTGLFLAQRRRRSELNPLRERHREVERRVGRALTELDRAQADGDAPAFFDAARQAIRERLSMRTLTPACAITLAELRERWPEVPASVLALLEACDSAAYSGRAVASAELDTWRASVREALSDLEISR